MNQFLGWRADEGAAKSYVDVVKRINENGDLYRIFRSGLHGYTHVLEHLSRSEGQIYANYIVENYPHLLRFVEEFKKNDSIGSPILFEYEFFGTINPTTLRYIKFAGDIEKTFGNSLNGIDLIEIGGGYGGLVRILSCLFDFRSISLFDLPEPLKLQKKFLSDFDIESSTNTITDDFFISDKSLVVSNYAWCECDREIRDLYREKILSRSNYNFLVIYDVDENELTTMHGKNSLEKETLNDCKIFTKINEL